MSDRHYGRYARSPIDRLMESVRPTQAGCWEWQKAKNTLGYGRMALGSRSDGTRRTEWAHRAAYQLLVGEIPEGLVLDHLCRNPSCVNPQHLEPVTTRENTVVRGVGGAADQARQTHCKRGHEFTPENTYRDKHGKRYCRACNRLYRQGLIGKKAKQMAVTDDADTSDG